MPMPTSAPRRCTRSASIVCDGFLEQQQVHGYIFLIFLVESVTCGAGLLVYCGQTRCLFVLGPLVEASRFLVFWEFFSLTFLMALLKRLRRGAASVVGVARISPLARIAADHAFTESLCVLCFGFGNVVLMRTERDERAATAQK